MEKYRRSLLRWVACTALAPYQKEIIATSPNELYWLNATAKLYPPQRFNFEFRVSSQCCATDSPWLPPHPSSAAGQSLSCTLDVVALLEFCISLITISPAWLCTYLIPPPLCYVNKPRARAIVLSVTRIVLSPPFFLICRGDSTPLTGTMSLGYSVGDFIAILQLANQIRERFVDAPKHFKAISNE